MAHSPCFRREAGSWGAHVRGLNRVHQFEKLELVEVVHPQQAEAALQAMLAHVQGLLERLQLPYRVLRLCKGELGFAAATTYDVELWAAGQQRWLEVSSVSDFGSYQARRLQLHYRTKAGAKGYCHTLNGSALALPRVMAALLEHYQGPQGIAMPQVLQPYLGAAVL